MIDNETPVSHVDLYHKLGRLEALLETMMSSLGNFQVAIKDIHTRIDALETRQNALENSTSSATGAASALTTLAKDFALPFLAVAVTWLIAKEQVGETIKPRIIPSPAPLHAPHPGTIESIKSP